MIESQLSGLRGLAQSRQTTGRCLTSHVLSSGSTYVLPGTCHSRKSLNTQTGANSKCHSRTVETAPPLHPNSDGNSPFSPLVSPSLTCSNARPPASGDRNISAVSLAARLGSSGVPSFVQVDAPARLRRVSFPLLKSKENIDPRRARGKGRKNS